MAPSSTRTPRKRQRQVVDLDELARRIVAMGANPGGDDVGVFPSERELAKKAGVSRHAVRGAIDYLAQRGVVRRLPGGGAVKVGRQAGIAASPAALALRCINFLQGRAHLQESLQWLVQEYLIGYTEVLDLYDLKTRWMFWADDATDFARIFWNQASWREQGCVLLGRRSPQLLQWLNEQGVPSVMQSYAAYDDTGLPPHHRVYVNKMGGAFEATRHLLELGHRRIGFVGALPQPQTLSPEYEGWLAALRCVGLSPAPRDAFYFNSQEVEMAIGPCREYLQGALRPTAVLAGHGAAAVGLLLGAQSLNIRVPAELSIVGFTSNDTPNHPQLSVVDVPRRQLGRRAMEVLLQVARENLSPLESPQCHVLNCQLILNRTTAPPASGA